MIAVEEYDTKRIKSECPIPVSSVFLQVTIDVEVEDENEEEPAIPKLAIATNPRKNMTKNRFFADLVQHEDDIERDEDEFQIPCKRNKSKEKTLKLKMITKKSQLQ